MIRDAVPDDCKAISEIYNHYILNTIVTFEEIPIDANEMQRRITEVQNKLMWIVWEHEGTVVGYAYASSWKTRAAYRHSVELSVYLHPDFTGKGIGKRLYAYLLEDLRKRNIHAVMGGVALPNEASVRLHENLGFKKVAHFSEVGRKFDKWIDVAYWQLCLDTSS
jgi:phosphinothricin acetyltransferase